MATKKKGKKSKTAKKRRAKSASARRPAKKRKAAAAGRKPARRKRSSGAKAKPRAARPKPKARRAKTRTARAAPKAAKASSSRTRTRPRARLAPRGRGLGSESAGQSGDTAGLARAAGADSESVEELVEEGQAFEAGVVEGVENVPDADSRRGGVRTREVPVDDVPQEYLDKD
jgi:hypothetical protein